MDTEKKRHTILIVERVGLTRVFRHGRLRLKRIPAIPLGHIRGEKILLIRKKETFDSAQIEEIGTHGARDMFYGFAKCIPKSRRYLYGGSAISDWLCAWWFKIGDVIRIPCDPSTFQRTMIEEWRSQRQFAPKHRRAMKKAEVRGEELSKRRLRAFEKRHGFSVQDLLDKKVSPPPGIGAELLRAGRRIDRRALAQFYRQVYAEPLPKVIVLT